MTIKVALLEKDTRFLDRLTAIFSKNYSDKLEIYPFSDPEVAISSLPFIQPDVLLADESLRIPDDVLPKDCALAYFVSAVGADKVDGHRAICKFQRAELIYKQIVGILSDKANGAHGSETKFVTFTSPVGGVGVSTAAAAFALRLASQGHSVLYLDLDAYSCPSLSFRAEGEYTFADVLHTLVHKDKNLTELLVHATRKDPRGVSYFCEADASCVYPPLDAEAVARLLRELRIIAAFDYIVVDIPFSMLLQQEDLWERSSALVLLTDGTEQAQRKLARGYFTLLHKAESGLSAELFLLSNKCSAFVTKLPALSELRELGQIPFLSETDTRKKLSSMAELSLFDTLL